jgi:hypothetical protein
MNKRKPKNKYALELHFDTKVSRGNFIALFLDAGGADHMSMDVVAWGKTWMHIRSGNRCTKCELHYDSTRLIPDEKCSNCSAKLPQEK